MQTCRNQRNPKRNPNLFRSLGIQLVVYTLLLFSTPPFLSAAVFQIPAGDVPGLIAVINASNANGEENTIFLQAGTYTLTKADNGTGFDHSGLPVISSSLTIRGDRAGTTVIERDVNVEGFRLLKVAATGTVTLKGLTLRNGGHSRLQLLDFGGGIYNNGTVTLINCILTHNMAQFSGGIENDIGTVTLINSTLVANDGSSGIGAIENGGMLTLTNSTVANNRGDYVGAIRNGGTVTLINSTVANNRGDFDGGGIVNGGTGTVTLINSTIVANLTEDNRGGGIANSGGPVTLQNTILARNGQIPPGGAPQAGDCFGSITSLGNNVIGDLTGCNIKLQSTDLTGNPGLGAFVDDGSPGNGRVPLLQISQAINAGNDAPCPATDQLGTPRNGRCDIGAVEFYPLINDLVALANVSTNLDSTPVPSGPAGTFRITAEFTNTSTQAIVHPFAEVVELTGGNLLLNADGGAGGVGARVTSSDSVSNPFLPGATDTLEFLIGLEKQESFTFFVNMLGEPQPATPLLSKR
jgi:hypothetical protein